MRSSVSFVLDGTIVTEDFSGDATTPTTTVLNYLRGLPNHKGVKEGCAEGDCGACTVVLGEAGPGNTIHYKAVDACLVFLPMIHGKELVTVENLAAHGQLHPVQTAMVEAGGSQCGFCTPGIVMSLFALYKNHRQPQRADIDDALTGNLCRCTGYRPIVEAAAAACVHHGFDTFSADEPRIAELLRSITRNSARIATHTQTYFQPATLEEALDLKHRHPDAFIVCGATDVALRVTKNNEVLPVLLDLSAIDEMRDIREEAGSLRIGAGMILNDAYPIIQQDFPALADTFSVFGSLQIRNLATLGGNLGSASPIGDTLSALMPYNARIILKSSSGTREVPIDTFVTGYRQTVRKPDELIVEVILPKPHPETHVKWYKVSKRKDLDISTVSGGFRVDLDPLRNVQSAVLAYGGMADRVRRSPTTEQFLLGKPWTRETIEAAMNFVAEDFTPISDARGSAEFRTIAAKNLLLKFWSETRTGANGHPH